MADEAAISQYRLGRFSLKPSNKTDWLQQFIVAAAKQTRLARDAERAAAADPDAANSGDDVDMI